MKITLSNAFLFLSLFLSAQSTFIVGNGKFQAPTDFVQTSDNGFLIGGQMLDTMSGITDMCALLKLDSIGNEEWNLMYSDGGHDTWVTSVMETSDGNYISCGRPDGILTHQCFMTKVNSWGSIIWSRSFALPNFSSDAPIYCLESADGNYVVVASQYNLNSNYFLSLIKLDDSGSIIWEQNFNDSISPIGNCYSIIQTSDNGYALTGGWSSYCFILQTDSLGNQLWYKVYNDSLYRSSAGKSIKQMPDKGFIVACSNSSNGFGDAMIFRTDSLGDILWTRLLSGSEYHFINSVEQTSDSNFVCAGSVGNINNQTQRLLILNMDQFGDTLWTRTYKPGTVNHSGIKTIQTHDSCLATLSSVFISTNLYKTDGYGNLDCYRDTSSTTISQIQLIISPKQLTSDSNQGINNLLVYSQSYPMNTSTSCLSLGFDSKLSFPDSISIFPDPAIDKINIRCSTPIIEINLFSILGELMLAEKNKTEITLTNISPGIYYLIVNTNTGAITRKFIKQ